MEIIFFFLISQKFFLVCSLIRKGCHFLFVCLIVLFLLSHVCGECECVCVLRGGGGEDFCLDGVGCFCCLKNPGYDKFKFMISSMTHLHFNAFMTVFCHFIFILGLTTFGGSVRSVFCLFLLGLVGSLLVLLSFCQNFARVLVSAAF